MLSKILISMLWFVFEVFFEGLYVVFTFALEEDEEEEEDVEEEVNKLVVKKKVVLKKKVMMSCVKKVKIELFEVEVCEGEDKFDVDKVDGLFINDGMVTIRKRFVDEIIGVEYVVIEWNSDFLMDMIVDVMLSVIL